MPTRIASRRKVERHALKLDESTLVEFRYPSSGPVWKLPLIDMSQSGLSFGAEEGELPPLESGISIPGVTVRIGNCAIQGELLIMHVTPRPNSRILCGALLYPASDPDLIKLRAVLAGMEAVQAP
jgi:hypothetical protein